MTWPSPRNWRIDLQPDLELVVDRERGGGRAADVGQLIAGACLRQRLQRHAHRQQEDDELFQSDVASRCWTPGAARSFSFRAPKSVSEAKSASRERSPRTSVICPQCGQPRKRLTT